MSVCVVRPRKVDKREVPGDDSKREVPLGDFLSISVGA